MNTDLLVNEVDKLLCNLALHGEMSERQETVFVLLHMARIAVANARVADTENKQLLMKESLRSTRNLFLQLQELGLEFDENLLELAPLKLTQR